MISFVHPSFPFASHFLGEFPPLSDNIHCNNNNVKKQIDVLPIKHQALHKYIYIIVLLLYEYTLISHKLGLVTIELVTKGHIAMYTNFMF